MAEETKRASWLELFYDLAFVALIAQLTYLTADHHKTIPDLLGIFIIGYMIFNAWWFTTANRNIQNSEDNIDKLFIQAQMVIAFLMSIAMPDVFEGNYTNFFVFFAVLRAVQILAMLRMFRLYPEEKPKTYNILQGLGIAALLWLVVGFTPDPYVYVVAFSALALDILAAQTTGKGNKRRLLNMNHLQERLGLFLILVLGESMLVVAIANTASSVDAARSFYVMSGLLVAISLWWIYFRDLEACSEGIRPKNLFIYLHAHGFLFGSIILMAAGYKNLLKHVEPKTEDLLLVGAGVIGMALTISFIRFALRGLRKRSLISAALFAALVVAILYVGITYQFEIEALIVLTALCVGLAFLDERRRVMMRISRSSS